MAKEKESYFDVALAYMRGDLELTEGPWGKDSVLTHFVEWWDGQTPHFRQCVGSVFHVASQFKRKKKRSKKEKS